MRYWLHSNAIEKFQVIICPIATAQHETLPKSLASVSQCVYRRSYGRNFFPIFTKFCTGSGPEE